MTQQAQDIDAVNRYIMSTKANTQDAKDVRDEWLEFHDGLSTYEKHLESDIWDKVRNFRARFQLANAKTAAAKEKIKEVLDTGMTSEEVQGDVRRTSSTGMYNEDPDPIVPTRWKWYLGLAAIIAGAGLVGKKVYVDPWLGTLGKARKRIDGYL